MFGAAQKASLAIEGDGTVPCLFNPKDFSVTKSNSWKTEATAGKTAEPPTFGGGQPRELTLQLLFDATLLEGVSVADICAKLFKAMKASKNEGSGPNKTRPPTMTFTWGGFSFLGVAKSLTVQYQLFRPDGAPIRADVKLSLMDYDVKSAGGQNPTTRSSGDLGAHVVRQGDSLASIAYRVYGDPTHWRVIAEANGIDDPLTLHNGRALSVPSLDT